MATISMGAEGNIVSTQSGRGGGCAPVDATWKDAEEERLKKLQQGIDNIPIEDTRLGRKKEETKELLFASLPTRSAEEKERVRVMLVDDDGDVTQFDTV